MTEKEAQTLPATLPEKQIESNGKRITDGGLTRLRPQSFTELEHIAQVLGKSDIVPKEMIGKPANILLALMFGDEIGLTPAQSLQSVMVINGRPSLWGDAVMGLVLASPVYEDSKDEFDDKTMTATFRAKRKGKDWVVRTFSQADAQKSKLWTKAGPWQDYPKRMLFHRARSWALRDAFADILKGIRYFEEERDVIILEKQTDKTYAMPKSTDEPEDKAPEPAKPETVAPDKALCLEKITSKADRDGVILYFYCSDGKRYEMTTSIKEADRVEKTANQWIADKTPLALDLNGDKITGVAPKGA